MKRIARLTTMAWVVAAACVGATGVSYAQGKKGVTEPEIRYQAGGSPLAGEEMHQDINPKAPPMTKAEFDTAAADLLRALRRLPRRAAQGRDRQAADAGHHDRHRAPST